MTRRTAIICSVLTVILLVGNVVLPPIVYHSYTRDSDVGLWFMVGVFLTELSLIGCIIRWEYGQLQWRIIGAACTLLIFLVCGLSAAALVGPMSSTDGVTFLELTLSTASLFTVLDLVALSLSKFWLTRSNCISTCKATEVLADDESVAVGTTNFHFGFPFLFCVLTLSAFFALLLRIALDFDAVAYRDWRNYQTKGIPMLLTLGIFLWVLHLSLLLSTLQIRYRRGMIASLTLAVLGCEMLRRVEQSIRGEPLNYLDWEFSMIVCGFLTAHFVLGFLVRWFGWDLKQLTTQPSAHVEPSVRPH